jgi:hypothetical protein
VRLGIAKASGPYFCALQPDSPRSRWRDGHSFRRAPLCNERRPTVLITRGEAIPVLFARALAELKS